MFYIPLFVQDSSLQKLLFANEVPEYQRKVEQFYKTLSESDDIPEGQFANEMTKVSNVSSCPVMKKKCFTSVNLKCFKSRDLCCITFTNSIVIFSVPAL